MASKNCAAHWEQAEAVIIGAGSGLSTSADFVYMWERFEKHFYDGIVADYPQTVWIDIQVDVTGIIIKWKNTQLLWSSMFNCHYRHRTVWIGFILCSVEFRGGNDLITQCYYSSNQRSYFRILLLSESGNSETRKDSAIDLAEIFWHLVIFSGFEWVIGYPLYCK